MCHLHATSGARGAGGTPALPGIDKISRALGVEPNEIFLFGGAASAGGADVDEKALFKVIGATPPWLRPLVLDIVKRTVQWGRAGRR